MIKKLNVKVTCNNTNTIFSISEDIDLEKMTRYDLCITNPIPCDGLNLPIVIEVKNKNCVSGTSAIVNSNDIVASAAIESSKNPSKKLYDLIRFGLGDEIFGCDEKCIKCIRTYFNSEEKFVDLRIREYKPYCDC